MLLGVARERQGRVLVRCVLLTLEKAVSCGSLTSTYDTVVITSQVEVKPQPGSTNTGETRAKVMASLLKNC